MSEREATESVMRRLEKLLALANDARANPNEAAAAAAMASRIMMKHQIEEIDVVMARMSSGADLGDETYIPTLAEWPEPLLRVPKWASLLATYIGRLNGVRGCKHMVRTPKGLEACLKFSGYKPDVQLSVYMLTYFQAVIRGLREDFKKTGTYKLRGVASLRAYTDGLAAGIIENLENEMDRRKAERMSAAAGGDKPSDNRELMLVDAKAKIIEEKYGPELTKTTKFNTQPGFVKGVLDGRKVAVKTPIAATPATPSIALPKPGGSPADSITALLG